ncbi:hypothetical protein L3Q67_30975 [Saccharothrix sp. AJ9571]|nr:hypothetical protein L3Q67_30975 [Saccharothrix sp. AJ9571]
MALIDALLHALPLRDLRGDVGTKHSAKGGATALVDLEPAAEFEAVDAIDERIRADSRDFPELVPLCFTNIVLGVQAEFEERFDNPTPPIRVVVREVLPHIIETNEANNRAAGRKAVQAGLRRLVVPGAECLMPAIAVRWYDDDPQPGLVEVALTDRHGTVHRLIGKTPYFDADHELDPSAPYPFVAGVPGTVVEIDGDTAVVELLHHLDDQKEDFQRIGVRLGTLLPY